MKLKFKVQSYQTNAVNDVVDVFEGQPVIHGLAYRIDHGQNQQASAFDEGFRNSDIVLTDDQILKNIKRVQCRQRLPVSQSLMDFTKLTAGGEIVKAPANYMRAARAASKIHLDVEMETGTGKTYCYIKTMFEMNRRYGWSKYIVVVPSIAIREGVYKSLEMTADHFAESYGKKARFFIYNSKRLHELESFSSDAGINVLVINIQAFNARGADNLRIYEELDEFQSRKPIDVIASNRPVLILDEPQKMEGEATMEALQKFAPLFVLRYSATHRTQHNLVHRLDALDAYNQKLVKKIAVRGIQTRGLAGTNAYLYLAGIEISKNAPVARIEMEVKPKSKDIKRKLKRLKFGDNLFVESGELEQYRDFTISQIDAVSDTVEFTNGQSLKAGEPKGDVTEEDIRRIQIRETIKAHLDKEKRLFAQGIKVLSLFFIDEVAKYRDYDRTDEKGEYARIFEEQYEQEKEMYLSELAVDNKKYREYLADIDPANTHKGYFSIDRKTNRFQNPKVNRKSIDSEDVAAYDLILKDKERLLSLDEPTRFIFSHSALREGWDNPNVFAMCMLKHSDNSISRRQEVGRGLRLSVDQHGNRMDHPAFVHDINVLTVVASESYKDFVAGLQREVAETLTSRPRQATEAFFTDMKIVTENGSEEVSPARAKLIYRYLVKNDYSDDTDQITDAYIEAREAGTLAELPEELKTYDEQIFGLIDSVFRDAQLPVPDNGRSPKTNPLNSNFKKKEFQELWDRINRKAVYRVEFDSEELIKKCVSALNSHLRVTPLQYNVIRGIQEDELTEEQVREGEGIRVVNTKVEYGGSIHSQVKYDLVGKIADNAQLTRNTAANILSQLEPAIFEQFKMNPEHFISESSRIIAELKAAMVIEHLTYDEVDKRYGMDIFTENQADQDFSRATAKLKNHIYDYAINDSNVESDFVKNLETSDEVVVYAKLPRGFLIPTPIGDYNPDWAISFKSGSVQHIYFVAETKGSMSSLKLRQIEKAKIECARKFFKEISQNIAKDKVKYDVVTDYGRLMDLVGPAA